MNANLLRKATGYAAAATLASWLVACGGGAEGTGDTTPPVSPASFSTGVMVKGSVKVNGIEFRDAGAQVIDDRGRTVAQLQTGMVVSVRGRVDANGTTGQAEVIEVRNELRGTVDSVDTIASPPTLTIRGVTVRTDDSTVNRALVTGALAGRYVEIHALRDDAGNLRATLVDDSAAQSPGSDELRGRITSANIAGRSFNLGAVVVTWPATGTAFSPAATCLAALSVDLAVEVRGSFASPNNFTATKIDCEDLDDDANGLKPPANARNELEGYVGGLNSPDNNVSGSFTLNGVTVNFSASTQIRNGARADLANGVRVEVDGTRNGNTLTAREISFKQDRIILQGAASNVTTTGLTVLGQSVQRNDLTRVSVNGGLVNTARVEVRARLVNGTLIADEIRDASGGGGGTREIVQARATAKTASSVTLLGTAYTFNGNTVCKDSRGATEVTVACSALLDAVNVTTGTLVKVRGTPLSAGVEEAALED